MNYEGLIITLFLFTIIYGLGFYFFKRNSNKEWLTILKSTKTLYLALIGWTILGFLLNLDYNTQWGCIISSEPILSQQNLLYSGVALITFAIGYFSSNRPLRIILLVAELLFWIYKLIIIKGGYAVGFGGVPSFSILMFDIIALTLRLLLIKRVFLFKFNSSYVIIPTLIIIMVKVNFFPVQQSIISEIENYPIEFEISNNDDFDESEYSEFKITKKEEYPLWLIKLYPDTIGVEYDWLTYQQVILFKQLNDSVSYCIYETQDGVSSIVNFASHINEKEFQSVQIEANVDHDQSIPDYSWSEYKILDNGKIETTEYFEFVPDSLLDKNGQIEEGKSYDDYDLEYDTVVTVYTILSTGVIASKIADNAQKNIFGIWTLDNSGPHADMRIDQESYFVVDYDGDGSMPYTFQNDTLSVQFPDFLYSGYVEKATNDTLIIHWEYEERTIYVKWNN